MGSKTVLFRKKLRCGGHCGREITTPLEPQPVSESPLVMVGRAQESEREGVDVGQHTRTQWDPYNPPCVVVG